MDDVSVLCLVLPSQRRAVEKSRKWLVEVPKNGQLKFGRGLATVWLALAFLATVARGIDGSDGHFRAKKPFSWPKSQKFGRDFGQG